MNMSQQELIEEAVSAAIKKLYEMKMKELKGLKGLAQSVVEGGKS